MTSAGLRARVIAAFAVGALLLSALMALFSYELTRRSLLAGRERATMRATSYDAPVIPSSLDTGSRTWWRCCARSTPAATAGRCCACDGHWYTRNADTGAADAVPAGLQRLVEQGGQGAVSGSALDGVPRCWSGFRWPDGRCYEIDYLRELDQTLQVVGLGLVAVAIAVAGGRRGPRLVRDPVQRCGRCARSPTPRRASPTGDLAARLDPAAEPDLARLTALVQRDGRPAGAPHERDRRFAADVSHELRSPLQTLAASASVLHRRRAHLDERTAPAAGLVVDEMTRFQSLVDDLLELARSDQPAHRGRSTWTTWPGPLPGRGSCRRAWWSRPATTRAAGGSTGAGSSRSLAEPARQRGSGTAAARSRSASIRGDGAGGRRGRRRGPRRAAGRPDGDLRPVRAGPGRCPTGGGDGTGLGLALVAQHAKAHGGRRGSWTARPRRPLPGRAAGALP